MTQRPKHDRESVQALRMPDRERFLRSISLLEGTNDEVVRALAASSVRGQVAAGEVIFDEDDPAAAIHVVRRGWAKVFRHGSSGRSVLFDIAGPGDLLDGGSVALSARHSVTAQAWSDLDTLILPKGVFKQIARQHPLIWRNLAGELSERLKTSLQCGMYVTLSVEERLARLLAFLGQRAGRFEGGYARLDLPITQRELAEMIGTTTETACRVWSRWRKQGKVGRIGASIVVGPFEELAEIDRTDGMLVATPPFGGGTVMAGSGIE